MIHSSPKTTQHLLGKRQSPQRCSQTPDINRNTSVTIYSRYTYYIKDIYSMIINNPKAKICAFPYEIHSYKLDNDPLLTI